MDLSQWGGVGGTHLPALAWMHLAFNFALVLGIGGGELKCARAVLGWLLDLTLLGLR